MSRNARKPGGLNFNPLLERTELAPSEADARSVEETALPVDTSTRGQIHPSTRVHANAPAASAPIKFTFYFTPEQLDRLDGAWETFRRRQRGTGPRISKSQFVRVALDRLLDDFDRDPETVMAQLRQSPQEPQL